MIRIVFAALLVSACASTSQQAGHDGFAPTNNNGDEIVCVDQAFTGSLMSREICHTRADWQAQHDDTLQFMQHPRPMYGH